MPLNDKRIAQQWANILKRMAYHELGQCRANMLEQYWADAQTLRWPKITLQQRANEIEILGPM